MRGESMCAPSMRMPRSMLSLPTTKAMKLLFIHLRYTRSPGISAAPASIRSSRFWKPAARHTRSALAAASRSVLLRSRNAR